MPEKPKKKWYYDDAAGNRRRVAAHTKSEARAGLKAVPGLKPRLPVGARVHREDEDAK